MSAAQHVGGELPQDERGAFDEWWAKFESAHPDWRYADAYAMRWNVWQARAALAQRAGSVPAQVGQEREAPDDLFDLIREWAHLPEGQRGNAARSIIGCVNRSYSAGVADGKVLGALAAPVPAASVQPETPTQMALRLLKTDEAFRDAVLADVRAAKEPDIRRDAALVAFELPELPKFYSSDWPRTFQELYTEDQMKEYALSSVDKFKKEQ